MQRELLAAEGLGHVEFELSPHLHAGIHFGLEEAEAAPPLHLGPVEGEIGAFQETVSIRSVLGRQGDADAGANRQKMTVDHVGSAHQIHEAASKGAGLLDPYHGPLHDHEFVAANPRHGIAGAQAGTQAVGDLAEERVADSMAQCIIDGLEAVEIHQQHGAAFVPRSQMPQGRVQALAQAVRQAGQGVEARPLSGLGLRGPARGHVLQDDRPVHARVQEPLNGMHRDVEDQGRTQGLEGDAFTQMDRPAQLFEEDPAWQGQGRAEVA